MNKRGLGYWGLLLICALAWWLRVHALGEESFWLDEAVSVNWAQLGAGDLITTTAADVHPPTYYLLLKVWGQPTGYSEFSARFLSAMLGTLSIPLLYLCARWAVGPRVALLAATLMALSQFHIYYSQEARNYALLVLLALISCTALTVRWQRRGRRATFVYLVSTVLLVYVHLYAWFVVAAQNMFWAWQRWRRSNSGPAAREWIVTQAAIVGLFLPWAVVLSNQTRAVLADYWLGRPDAATLINVLYQYSGSVAAFGATLAVVAIAGYERIRRPHANAALPANAQPAGLLAAWLIVPHLIPFTLSQWVSPIYLPRATIVALPAFLILLAAALWAIRQPWIRGGMMVVLIGAYAWTLTSYYPTTWKQQWREATAYVETNAQPGEAVFFSPGYGRVGYARYAHRADLQLRALPAEGERIEPLAATRVWVIALEQPGAQTTLAAQLAPAYTLSHIQRFVAIDVFLFTAQP